MQMYDIKQVNGTSAEPIEAELVSVEEARWLDPNNMFLAILEF